MELPVLPDPPTVVPSAVLRAKEPVMVPPGVWTVLPWEIHTDCSWTALDPGRPGRIPSPRPGIYRAQLALDLPPTPSRGRALLEIRCHAHGREDRWGWTLADVGPIPHPDDPTGPKLRAHDTTNLRVAGISSFEMTDWEWVETRLLLSLAEPANVHMPPSDVTRLEIQWVGP